MKILGILAFTVLASASANADDTAFENSGLQYQALAAGQNERAAEQLEAAKLSSKDPAHLINLGRAYVRLGQMDKAADAFRTAMSSSNQFDVRLADGRVMSSREAAQLSLQQVQERIASR